MRDILLHRSFRSLVPFLVLCLYSNFFGFKHFYDISRLVQLVLLPIVLLSMWRNGNFTFTLSLRYTVLFPLILILTSVNAKVSFGVSHVEWIVSNSYYFFIILVLYFRSVDFNVLKSAISWYYWVYSFFTYFTMSEVFKGEFLYIPDNLPTSEAFIPGIQIFVAIGIYRILQGLRKESMLFVFNTLIVVSMTDNRASIISVSLVIITILSYKVSFRRMLIVLFSILMYIFISSSTMGAEIQSNLTDMDYPRIRSVVYFFSDYYHDLYDWLFGFGLGNSDSSLGRLQDNLRDVGIFHSDLGLLGTLFQIGIVGLLFFLLTINHMAKGQYRTLIWLYMLSGFTMHYFLSSISFVFIALVLTISRNFDESLPIPLQSRSV